MRIKIMLYAIYFLLLDVSFLQTHDGNYSNILMYFSILLLIISLIWDINYLLKRWNKNEK